MPRYDSLAIAALASLAWMMTPAWAQQEPQADGPALQTTQTVTAEPTPATDVTDVETAAPLIALTEEVLTGKWDLDLNATQSFVNLGFTQGIQTLGPRTWWLLEDNFMRAGADDPQGPAGFWGVENGKLLVREPGQTDITELDAQLRGDVLTVQLPGVGDGSKLVFKRDKSFGKKTTGDESDEERLAGDSTFEASLDSILPTQTPLAGLIQTVLNAANTTVGNLPPVAGLGAADLTQGVTTLLLPDGTVMALDNTVAGLDPTGGTLTGTLTDTVSGTGGTLNTLTSPDGTIGSAASTVTGTVDNILP